MWKKLRDCFREAIKRQKDTKSGQGAVKMKEWKFQKQMQFLLPYMSTRRYANIICNMRKQSLTVTIKVINVEIKNLS